MRSDYERGATRAELAAHYDIKRNTIAKKAWRDEWKKPTALAPPQWVVRVLTGVGADGAP